MPVTAGYGAGQYGIGPYGLDFTVGVPTATVQSNVQTTESQTSAVTVTTSSSAT
jgi:hypothetical protein